MAPPECWNCCPCPCDWKEKHEDSQVEMQQAVHYLVLRRFGRVYCNVQHAFRNCETETQWRPTRYAMERAGAGRSALVLWGGGNKTETLL